LQLWIGGSPASYKIILGQENIDLRLQNGYNHNGYNLKAAA